MRQTINARTIATQRGTVIPSGAPPAETGEVLTRKHASTASIFAGLLKANTIRKIESSGLATWPQEHRGRSKRPRVARNSQCHQKCSGGIPFSRNS